MPFCAKCGLFFAKGKECSCMTGGDPAEAARSERVVVAAPAPAVVVAPPPKDAGTKKSWAARRQEHQPAPARSTNHAPDEDRGAVVSERTSTSNKYCSGCSEPKTLCKCQPDEGVPFYGRNKSEPVAPVNASAFCEACLEPRGLCACRKAAPAASAASPRGGGGGGGVSAREESDRQYAEPARGGRGGAEVSSEGLVMGGSNFCASCGE